VKRNESDIVWHVTRDSNSNNNVDGCCVTVFTYGWCVAGTSEVCEGTSAWPGAES